MASKKGTKKTKGIDKDVESAKKAGMSYGLYTGLRDQKPINNPYKKENRPCGN